MSYTTIQKYPIVCQHCMSQFEDLPQVLLHNPRQKTPSRLSPSIVSVLWHASCASSSSLGKIHGVAYHFFSVSVLWHASRIFPSSPGQTHSAGDIIQCFTVCHSSKLLHHPKSNTSITFTTYSFNAKIHFNGVFTHPI